MLEQRQRGVETALKLAENSKIIPMARQFDALTEPAGDPRDTDVGITGGQG